MKKNNSSSITEQFFVFLQTGTDLIAEILNLAILEAKLSAKSLGIIAALLILVLVILITTWMCILAALSFFLISLHLKPALVFILVGLANLLPIIPIIFMIRSNLQQVGMDSTIRQLSYKPEKLE
jgi:hypothetical protein